MKRIVVVMILLLVLANMPVRVNASGEGIPVGGLHILKTNVTGTPLEGAVFQIARELREGELTDPAVEKRYLRIGEENRIMAMETFWSDRDMKTQRQREFSTDSEGKAAVFGLPYGTYYLVENKAPEGYNRIAAPIRVTIHKYSHLTEADGVCDDKNELIDNTLHIINVRYTLPDTATWGTLQLAAAGTGIIFSSGALLFLNRRRW